MGPKKKLLSKAKAKHSSWISSEEDANSSSSDQNDDLFDKETMDELFPGKKKNFFDTLSSDEEEHAASINFIVDENTDVQSSNNPMQEISMDNIGSAVPLDVSEEVIPSTSTAQNPNHLDLVKWNKAEWNKVQQELVHTKGMILSKVLKFN